MYMDSLRAVKAQQAQNRAGIKDKALIKSNTICKRQSQVEECCNSNCRQCATISITVPIFDLPFECVKGDISCGISWCVLALESAAVTGILGWVSSSPAWMFCSTEMEQKHATAILVKAAIWGSFTEYHAWQPSKNDAWFQILPGPDTGTWRGEKVESHKKLSC